MIPSTSALTLTLTPATHTPERPMNAPVPSSTSAHAKARNPTSFSPARVAGVVGVLVLLSRPTTRPTPAALRTTFDDAIVGRALSTTAPAAEHARASAFLGGLPDVVTPVAALGLAVRVAVETECKWVHNRTVEKASRWTYCASHVDEHSVSIHGAGTAAEASPDGTLTIDADVPHDVADRLRAAYTEARGVVEPSRVTALVCAHLVRSGARAITSDVYLLPDVDAVTCGVLAGLVDLGGWSETIAVADPERIARLSSPVTRSIEEQIADVVKATEEFIARAALATAPDGPTLQKRTGETVREGIAAARSAASMWRDRLSLASLDVDAQLDSLDVAAKKADDDAQRAIEERRAVRDAARLAAKGGAA